MCKCGRINVILIGTCVMIEIYLKANAFQIAHAKINHFNHTMLSIQLLQHVFIYIYCIMCSKDECLSSLCLYWDLKSNIQVMTTVMTFLKVIRKIIPKRVLAVINNL